MADQTSDEIREITEKGQEEAAMVTQAKRVFIAKGNLEPVKKKVTAWFILKTYGMESIFQVISLLGAVYVSSLRVGILMELTQANLIENFLVGNTVIQGSAFFNSIEAMRWAAMAAFEGALIAAGFKVGSRMKTSKHSEWVTYAALAVTILSGALSSLTIVDNSEDWVFWFSIAFAIASTVAAPFIVKYMAENVGFLWKEIINAQGVLDKEWKDDHDKWSDEFEKEWPYLSMQLFGEERRRKLTKFDDGVKSGNNTPTPEPQDKGDSSSPTERVRKYLLDNGLHPDDIGTTDEHRKRPADVTAGAKLVGNERNQVHGILKRLAKSWPN